MLKIEEITEEEYHKIKGFTPNIEDSTISASLLKDIDKRGLFEVLKNKVEHDSNTLELFRVGSLVHLFVLEPSLFVKEYYMGELNPSEDRQRVGDTDCQMLEDFKEEILKKYPYMMDEENAELAIFGKYEGLNVKAKIDKFVVENNVIKVYDVKTTGLDMAKIKKDSHGKAWELSRTINDFNYAIQMCFYAELLVELYRQSGYHLEYECYILFLSKTDRKARMVKLSEETIGYAKIKLDGLLTEVREYIYSGEVEEYTLV